MSRVNIFYFWTTITRCSACLNNLTESNFGNSYKICCQRTPVTVFNFECKFNPLCPWCLKLIFFLNSNYKNVKNINQKKNVQFLKNKRLHKTNLILCTFNIHMPNCYHTNSPTVYTQETNGKMYTKNLFNIKKDPNTTQYCPCKNKMFIIGKHSQRKNNTCPIYSNCATHWGIWECFEIIQKCKKEI